jgi:hypothetical protein
MYALLLALGALTGASGLALVATGVTAHDAAFGSEITIPGTIATVGGFILIGLALAVRQLQRIELALAARPMPRPVRPVEAPAAGAQGAGDRTVAPHLPFPPNPKPEVRPQSPPAGVVKPAEPSEDAALNRLRDKFPTLVRLERAPVAEEANDSLSPQARLEPVDNAIPVLKNGSAIVDKVAPPSQGKARKSAASGSVFEAFWPSGQRRRSTQFAAVPATAEPPVNAGEPAHDVSDAMVASEPVPAVHERETAPPGVAPGAPPITILKSGVVEGMAYALYSDGSIEAQLPEGRLRFGSITELRSHIENAS